MYVLQPRDDEYPKERHESAEIAHDSPSGVLEPDPRRRRAAEKLLVCTPCQIEFSLRETGSSRRDAGRIFVHLVPDYFYTPTMWDLYADEIFARFTGRR